MISPDALFQGLNVPTNNHKKTPSHSLADTHMLHLPSDLDGGLGTVARMGVIVLQTDQTIEHELASLLQLPGVATYHCRIANAMEVTASALAQMEADLPMAASLLPSQFDFDVVAYACTSGSTVIGEQRVQQAVQQAHPNVPVTNPLSACKAALAALGIKRVAFLTPYSPDVTSAMQANLTEAGFDIVVTGSFDLTDDFEVGRVSPQSIADAVRVLADKQPCDGVFVSCTSLRVANLIPALEADLGIPVTSSNHALAWHMLRLAGVHDAMPHKGRLFGAV
jgi:maleate isomerase